MQQLYAQEYKFERRHKRPFAKFDEVTGNAFFDVVGGCYPNDEALRYISQAYDQIFSLEKLPLSEGSAMKLHREGFAGPSGVTRHELEVSVRNGISDRTFYVFDPTNAGDVIDYWNYRLIERNVIPINLEWFAQHSDFIREGILQLHRPIPGNPYETKFHSTVHFGWSVSDETARGLLTEYLSGLPDMSWMWGRDPKIWRPVGRGYDRRETKVMASSKAISFDEEFSSDHYVKLPAPAPTFLNASGRYTKARWVNLIVPSSHGNQSAVVYPSNQWAPNYPRLASGENLRIGREGWALQQEHGIGFSMLKLQDGREAITGWLKTQGIEAQPSEEGQVAAQVIAAAGGLRGAGMFADRETINLLSEMAESRSDRSRDGKRVAATTPDRSKHVNTVRQHFDQRVKRSFGYWNELNYFLERSVFRAGLRVQCPVCSYRNWFDLDTISYSPVCTRCLNKFQFSQSPTDLHDADWFYRVVGPFAAPDYARGGYAVALTLRCLNGPHETEMTWTTGLYLQTLNCEVDFAAWHRPGSMLDDERDEPLFVIGEAKSFGKNAINEEVVASLGKVADRFPGAIMVVSSLREIADYTAEEIQRLRDLALWGRRETYRGQPRNPLVVFTGTELFARRGVFDAWKEEGGPGVPPSIHSADLHALAELTQKRYLGLPGYWEERIKARKLTYHRHHLIRLIQGRAA